MKIFAWAPPYARPCANPCKTCCLHKFGCCLRRHSATTDGIFLRPAGVTARRHASYPRVMLANLVGGSLCTLRPTLIYGIEDPHNGYGPNKFWRSAAAGEDIVLFGNGEERRDHVWVEDVAEVVVRVLLHQSIGCLNVATGKVHSFRISPNRSVACRRVPFR